MRILVLIGVLVMQAVRGDPENRAALERQRAADGEEVFEQLMGLETAVRVERWYPMLIPSPIESQYRNAATSRFVQLNDQNAATAWMWNQISTTQVITLSLL
jgi:hypothetical protein